MAPDFLQVKNTGVGKKIPDLGYAGGLVKPFRLNQNCDLLLQTLEMKFFKPGYVTILLVCF